MTLTRRDLALGASALGLAACGAPPRADPRIVNDITQLNPIQVAQVLSPQSIEEMVDALSRHVGPVSIGGGRFSQGGQTACTGCLFIDMRPLNRILDLNVDARTITVQAGATWRQIQEAIDPHDLSPEIMQSFSNFTVGGSLSVNCHGDYVGLGPVVESVRSIRVVLADGSIVTASRAANREIFDAAIGGYGGIGVITEATLELAPNERLERHTHYMHVADYPAWHQAHVVNEPRAILHHAVIYPPAYTNVAAEVSSRTEKPLTLAERLAPLGEPSAGARFLLDFVTFSPLGAAIHEHVYDPFTTGRTGVFWRNYIAARDAYSLEPASRALHTYALQEYFVPVDRYADFVPRMAEILNRHHANVLNVAVRFTRADQETLLAWARTDVYSFVLYYEQGTSAFARAEVGRWTRELVDAALVVNGSYYLPYQVHATRNQFLAAYPRAEAFFALKRRLDPSYKLRNRLWEAYYRSAQ